MLLGLRDRLCDVHQLAAHSVLSRLAVQPGQVNLSGTVDVLFLAGFGNFEKGIGPCSRRESFENSSDRRQRRFITEQQVVRCVLFDGC